ncbi:hypothetical protein AVEN_187969-1 [Araneus ventricosus]|uniref:Uncharacterized protein n=1 Tax=Araneus ventricosus TaxID=182803 RepID=A0A4Y2RWM0_ARAVE|nr:hypothetical protein AVEN_187969-1 [Araneus ventricosus]
MKEMLKYDVSLHAPSYTMSAWVVTLQKRTPLSSDTPGPGQRSTAILPSALLHSPFFKAKTSLSSGSSSKRKTSYHRSYQLKPSENFKRLADTQVPFFTIPEPSGSAMPDRKPLQLPPFFDHKNALSALSS